MLAVIVAMPAPSALADDTIDEIVVTADYRGRSAAELPAALSIIDGEQLEQLAVQHFEEVVGVVPNLNWSGDGHRARYFQIRGVGELEQYQGAPNPSVGFLIDDIDFSGIGTVGMLFDIERVEVLRGPQGSRYGANALGGLVYMQSTAPGDGRGGSVRLSAADDDARSAGIAFGGALDDAGTALFRISAHHHRANGFRDNPYLGRDDTNGRDETSVRGRLRLQPSDVVDINVALFYADVDNGYDAFALDNSYTVLSDKPGKDAQRSVGASLKIDWFVGASRQFTSLTSVADSDIEFSFDADWGNDDSWSPFVYDFVSRNDRSRRTLSQEFRLSETSRGP
ncbi:MAG: TonB-dependent receptor plug domain-containing protein, partial [Woeseiaceae bacterium]|nr:TonB-dependent receptor plug domain-containing protein [Woeseiaceae bacterium]